MRSRRSLLALLLVTALAVGACGASRADSEVARPQPGQALKNPGTRSLDAYKGLGTWVDVFDFAPAFQAPGADPAVSPANVSDMAALGINTLYLQASRDDPKSPGDLVEPELLTAFVRNAHANGMRVVAWYAPRLVDVATDVRRIQAMDAFRVDGHGFDGIGIDIESVDNENLTERNDALVAMSQQVRASVKGPISAIVLPPVQTEVVNPSYWPMFPWTRISKLYDVWLPMAYATWRSKPYRDHVRYITESVQRLRSNIKNSKAPVHVIGGLGDKMNTDDFEDVRQAALDTKALGWSVYDYAITPSTAWAPLRDGPGPG